MMENIIKINTINELPVVEIGNIVQFDELEPVMAVKFKSCKLCCLFKNCKKYSLLCGYISDSESVMFKTIKKTEEKAE